MSKLLAKPPKTVEKRFKALFYGTPGVGKTTAALQFPSPYYIDTERGAENDQYVAMLEKAGGDYLFTTDPDIIIQQVTALLSEKHHYKTLVIDPLTPIYNSLIQKGMDEKGEEFGRYKMVSDRAMRHLCTLLTRLDMNIIITSHAKDKWVRSKDAKGKEVAVQEGTTFDCYPKLDYLFDLVFEIRKRGTERVGIVQKTRVEAFADGDVFPFDYGTIADRYGRKILERSAQAEVLASPEQCAELRELLALRVDGETLLNKWLTKADAETIEELTAEVSAKCIAFLKPSNGVQP